MPGVMLEAFARLVPRMQAEQSLLIANAVMYGSGKMRDGDAWAAGMHRAALPDGERRRGMAEHVDTLKAMGIDVLVHDTGGGG